MMVLNVQGGFYYFIHPIAIVAFEDRSSVQTLGISYSSIAFFVVTVRIMKFLYNGGYNVCKKVI